MEEDPNITLGPLKIWISARQFPDHQDYWDGSWLVATALIEGECSQVQVRGPFLHLSELKKWKEDLQEFYRKLEGSVELKTMEPTLAVKITAKKSLTGQLDCNIEITGDHVTERHNYRLDIDQSYLPGLISQLAAVLREYPIKGER